MLTRAREGIAAGFVAGATQLLGKSFAELVGARERFACGPKMVPSHRRDCLSGKYVLQPEGNFRVSINNYAQAKREPTHVTRCTTASPLVRQTDSSVSCHLGESIQDGVRRHRVTARLCQRYSSGLYTSNAIDHCGFDSAVRVTYPLPRR